MHELDRLRDYKFCDFSVTINFFFSVSFAKRISYKWSYL